MKGKAGINKYIVTKVSKESQNDEFKDDYVTKCMGSFGYWQALICPIVCVVRFIVVWNIVSIVYMTPTTKFSCIRFKNGTDVERADVVNSTCYDDCIEYEYFTDVFEETLITQFGLICENEWLKSFVQTMTMFGLLIGVSGLGWVSDRYGRRKAHIIAATLAVTFMLASPFAPTYWIFTSFRFFVGIGIGGIMTLTVVVNIEMVGQKYRTIAGVLSVLPDGVAQVLLSAMAYHITSYRHLLLIYGPISVVILLMLLAVPETPRWLVAQRRGDEAIAMMTKVSKFNGLSTDHIKDTVEKAIEEMESRHKDPQTYQIWDLFRTAKLCRTTIFCITMWMTGGICFFGLNHYSTLLGLNIYVVVPLMGLLQSLGPFIALPINRYFGRKITIFSSFCIIGSAMAALIFIPDGHWGCSVSTGIGVMLSITFFGTSYTQANELFPTPLRNLGVGLSSAGSKIGAMISPFIANTHPHWVASTIFTVIPFIGALISLLLPETRGKALQDTVD